MKKKLPKWAAVVACLFLAVAGFVFYKNRPVDISKLERRDMSALFVVDMTHPEEVVGLSTDVFVGYVEQMEGTYYNNDIPYTRYQVKVIDTIKGDLAADTTVNVNKEGGVAVDKSCLMLYKGDFLPEEGQYYVFLTRKRSSDGSYTASGMNTSVLLDNSVLMNSAVYQNYVEAYKNEIPYDPYRE